MTNHQHDCSPEHSRLNEFALIDRYFKNKTLSRSDVMLGIGDDAALLEVPPHQLLVVAMDTMVEGVHFPPLTSAFDIGYKALAVNLSDLAAMGAMPAWLTLALTLPQPDSVWLEGFTDGLFHLANQYEMQLIGGDTTRGPLTITVQVHGFVPHEKALCRRGAKVGDKIYVSGTLGDAGLGLLAATGKLQLPKEDREFVLQRLNRPEPRIQLGFILRDFASSAIDISDGLLADLQHILDASFVGATIVTEQLPIADVLRRHLTVDDAKKMALTSGDDYELCFTVSPESEYDLLAQLAKAEIKCTVIGVITEHSTINLIDYAGNIHQSGYAHFKSV